MKKTSRFLIFFFMITFFILQPTWAGETTDLELTFWDKTLLELPPEDPVQELAPLQTIEWSQWSDIPFRDLTFTNVDFLIMP